MTRRQPAPTHWLRANEREWTPAHAIFVDTETRTEDAGERELLTLRCWAGVAVDRRNQRKTEPAERWAGEVTRAALADWITETTEHRKSSWLFTHNLTFDLTVTNLLDELTERGWQLGAEWSAYDRAPWFRMSLDGRNLAIADSVTWLPDKLANVAPKVGKVKLSDPPADDDAGWMVRCWEDVEILRAAMLELMDWWDRAGLGNWSVTGNTCGWNAMRHMTAKKTVLVKVGDGGREFERSAIYGGRRDSQRWGDVPGGPFVCLDFEDAYPTLAANIRLPARRMGGFDRLDIGQINAGDSAIQYAAECVVRCDSPRYPLRHAGSVWYPVGRFATVLAGPELTEAKDRGELESIGRGFRYWCDGHLAGWAAWVVDLAHGRIGDAPAVSALPAKRWGRSVLGRFAQRIGEATALGPAEAVGWGSSPIAWPADHAAGRLVDLAGTRWLVKQDVEADDSFPAVLAWVESATRVRLNRMLDRIGPASWTSCNTDGVVIDLTSAARSRSDALRGPVAPDRDRKSVV